MIGKILAGSAALAVAALSSVSGAAHAATISINLGPSAELFTLYGMGETSPGSGVGTFSIGQGAGTFNGSNSIFILSGAITGGSTGYSSGTYAFVTQYAGVNTPTAGPNAPRGQSNPGNLNQFFYSGLDSSTFMSLDLFGTPTGNHIIPLVQFGNFVSGTGFNFQFVSALCTGVVICGQNNVGITPGATIFGPVTIGASFTTTLVPEPATWALMVVGAGGLGVALRARRKVLAATA